MRQIFLKNKVNYRNKLKIEIFFIIKIKNNFQFLIDFI